MNLIRAMADIKLSVEDINNINELMVRDESLPVIPDPGDPSKWARCPKCQTLLNRDSDYTKFCRICGQRVDVDNDAL